MKKGSLHLLNFKEILVILQMECIHIIMGNGVME